jgi:sporulation protein YlmC with PRC-barrel domain
MEHHLAIAAHFAQTETWRDSICRGMAIKPCLTMGNIKGAKVTTEPVMKFTSGAEVFAANGQKLGNLGQVILDKDTSAVTHIVVRKGHLFWTDKIIPSEDIFQALENRTTLHTGAKIDDYPDFVQADFIPFADDGSSDGEPPSWYPPFWNHGQ